MKLSPDCLEEMSALAIGAALGAAKYVQSQAGGVLEVTKKDGGSSEASQVVTEGDFESQRFRSMERFRLLRASQATRFRSLSSHAMVSR
jgi:hypothetical protein